jgi:hypothetical protein
MEIVKESQIIQSFLRVQYAVENLLEESGFEEGTLAANLHNYYNKVGLKEGWLKPEYATPLFKQESDTQQKNVLAAQDVVKYWRTQFKRIDDILDRPYSHNLAHAITGEDEMELSAREDLIYEMITAVDYLKNCDRPHVNFGAESQHDQWRAFVEKYQHDRIDPQSPKFRQDNYKQFHTEYSDLSPKEKNQDRLILAIITDNILDRAEIGYQRKISE